MIRRCLICDAARPGGMICRACAEKRAAAWRKHADYWLDQWDGLEPDERRCVQEQLVYARERHDYYRSGRLRPGVSGGPTL